MACALCILGTETTDTHPEYVIFPQQQLLHECTSMLRYMYIFILTFDGAVLLIIFLWGTILTALMVRKCIMCIFILFF